MVLRSQRKEANQLLSDAQFVSGNAKSGTYPSQQPLLEDAQEGVREMRTKGKEGPSHFLPCILPCILLAELTRIPSSKELWEIAYKV